MNLKKRDIPRLSAAELEILQMLWREGGVTILEAQQALGLPIGYTTVQTRLNRLAKKGILSKSKERPTKYSAAVTSNEVGCNDLDLLVERVSNGQLAPLVAHLVNRESISREELRELKQLVTDAEKRLQRGERGKS
ncbi:MAG: BlaI/MecI/CopY family transcriptional regulator [Pirellulaceae bacterium]